MRWLEAELPGARAAFSTRVGGVSEAPYDALNVAIKTGDEPGRVVDNRRRLAAALGIAPENVVMGHQVHGAELRWHDGPQEPRVYADAVPQPRRGGRPRDRPAGPGAAGDGRRLPAGRPGRARAAWRWPTAAGAGSPAASLARAAEARGGRGRRDRARDRALLLRGRRRGAGASSPTSTGSPRGACSTCPRWRGRCSSAPASTRGRVRRALHELQPRALLLPPPRRRAHRPPGRPRLAGG